MRPLAQRAILAQCLSLGLLAARSVKLVNISSMNPLALLVILAQCPSLGQLAARSVKLVSIN